MTFSGGLTGFNNFKIDARSRLFIPSSFRKIIAPIGNEDIVVLFVPTIHLLIFNKEYWTTNIQKRIIDKSSIIGSQTVWRIIHRLSENSIISTIDNQGRIVISRDLLTKAKIQNSVLVFGAFDRISVWDPAKYYKWISSEDIEYVYENIGLI